MNVATKTDPKTMTDTLYKHAVYFAQISRFSNVKQNTPLQQMTVAEFLTEVKHGGVDKDKILKLRATQDEKQQALIKNSLSAVTLSVKCSDKRGAKKTKDDNGKECTVWRDGDQLSNFLQIDIDDIEPDDVNGLLDKLKTDDYTAFAFKSPRAKIKLGIMYDGEKHKDPDTFANFYYKQIEQYYKDNYNVTIDTSCKDPFRLCFMSYDPDLYFRETHPLSFQFQEPDTEHKAMETVEPTSKLKLVKTNGTANGTQKTPTRTANGTAKAEQILNTAIDTACKMIETSQDGEKHFDLLKASRLLGGYVGSNALSKHKATAILTDAIKKKPIKDLNNALKTIRDGVNEGSKKPIYIDNEVKKQREHAQRNTAPKLVNKETGEIISHVFWYEAPGKEKDSVILKINLKKLYDFIRSEKICFLVVKTEGNKAPIRYLVQAKNNIVKRIDIATIRQILKKYLNSLPDQISKNKTKDDLRDTVLRGVNGYIEQAKLDMELNVIHQSEFKKDSYDKSYFYFKNCFATVSKDGIETLPYSKLSGYIWESAIMKYNYSPIDDFDKIHDSNFVKFTMNTCTNKNDKTFDEKRYKALVCVIGYLLHTYTERDNARFVWFTESNMTDSAEGRSGKSLIANQALSQLRKVTLIDGRNFDPDNRFAFQQIDLDTQIVLYDDTDKYFKSEKLYSTITEGYTVEKKGESPVSIPHPHSPKPVGTTNFAPTDNSGSGLARRYDMELHQYYANNFTPRDEFKEIFFNESWTPEQWNLFYNFMLGCSEVYFQNDKKIPDYESLTISQRQLITSTSMEFVQYCDTCTRNEFMTPKEFHENYLEHTGLTTKEMTQSKLTRWLKNYCQHNGLRFVDKLQRDGKKVQRLYGIFENDDTSGTENISVVTEHGERENGFF